MPRFVVTGPDGHRYQVTAPEGASESDVMAHVKAEAAKAPAAPAKPEAPGYTDTHGPLSGAVLDTLGLSKRPGAKTPAGVVLNPSGPLEHGVSMAVKVPAYAAAGPWGALPLAGAEGAAAAAQRGEGAASMAGHGLLDVALAALTKGALSGASRALKPVAQSAAAQREIKEGLGWAKGKYFDKLMAEVAGKDTPAARGKAVEHAVSELNRLKAGVGDDFKTYVEGAKVGGAASSVADMLRRFVSSQGGRGLAQAAATEQVDPGLPGGALAAAGVGAARLPYVGKAVQAVEGLAH